MPRNARIVAPGIPYHITQRGSNRQRVFFTGGDRKLYLRLIRESQAEAEVRVLAYCREDSLAVLFGRANGRYAQALNIRKGRCGHLWQARFHSCPMAEAHVWMGLRYVEANPCRAGMVRAPEEYRWSSAAAHLLAAPDRSGVLDLEFWKRAGGAEARAELHGRELMGQQLVELRKCTYSGRPFGSEEFVQEMEDRFQRMWRRKKCGCDLGIREIRVKWRGRCPEYRVSRRGCSGCPQRPPAEILRRGVSDQG